MRIRKRRRREGKTNYSTRIKMLKSGKPRAIFRISERYLLAQYATSNEAQDKIEMNVSSKELLKFGWPKSTSIKNIGAAYLLGFLFAKRILKNKMENPIVDFGMQRTLHKTRVFGFIRGLTEGGLRIDCKKEALPPEERINGEHLKIKVDVEKIKAGIEKNE